MSVFEVQCNLKTCLVVSSNFFRLKIIMLIIENDEHLITF